MIGQEPGAMIFCARCRTWVWDLIEHERCGEYVLLRLAKDHYRAAVDIPRDLQTLFVR